VIARLQRLGGNRTLSHFREKSATLGRHFGTTFGARWRFPGPLQAQRSRDAKTAFRRRIVQNQE
jgi:hypothetical protein